MPGFATRRRLLALGLAAVVALTGCGDDGDDTAESESSTTTEADEETTTTEADEEETTTTADDDAAGDDDTLCAEITDAEVSEIVGIELSSAESPFNTADSCNYESEDGDYTLFVGRVDDLGQDDSFFISTGEANSEDFEELDGPGDAAYFGVLGEDSAYAASLGGGFVSSVDLDVPDGDDPLSHRDAVIELLDLLVGA